MDNRRIPATSTGPTLFNTSDLRLRMSNTHVKSKAQRSLWALRKAVQVGGVTRVFGGTMTFSSSIRLTVFLCTWMPSKSHSWEMRSAPKTSLTVSCQESVQPHPRQPVAAGAKAPRLSWAEGEGSPATFRQPKCLCPSEYSTKNAHCYQPRKSSRNGYGDA